MDAVYTHQLQAALQAECSTVAQNLMTMPHRIIAQLLATPEAERAAQTHIPHLQLHNVQGQIKQQDETIRSLKRQLLQADAEIKDYQAKEHTLRDIVLENTIGDKINDQDMIRKFTDLWQQIQSIVGSKTLKFDQLHKTIPSGLSQSSTKFYSEFIRLAQKDRASALKANIFSILHERILDKPFFGTEGVACEGLESTELGLVALESVLVSRAVPSHLIANWRIATLQALEAAGLQGCCGQSQANEIWTLLQPLIMSQAEPAEVGKLRDRAFRLADDACTFRLLMCRSKEGYRCESIPQNAKLLDYEHIAEVLTVQGGKHMGDRVAFTLFGALTKHADYRGEPPVLLEKALVSMQAK